MEVLVRQSRDSDLREMARIWNIVVEDGEAFPQRTAVMRNALGMLSQRTSQENHPSPRTQYVPRGIRMPIIRKTEGWPRPWYL